MNRRGHLVARGFTLLEVLVAIAILGLGLTVVMSAQTGVFWSYSRASHLSRAPSLMRCKMSEIELALLKDGYPLLDESDNGPCCEDDATDDYQCAWTIEKVELPEMPLGGLDGGVSGEPGGSDIGGVLGTLDDLQKGNTQQQAGGTQELAGLMEGVGAGSIATMAMSLVYPALKPMLEASIRKVTVTVSWKEGVRERSFGATQYLTSPAQGGLDPLAAEGLAESLDGLVPGAGGGGS